MEDGNRRVHLNQVKALVVANRAPLTVKIEGESFTVTQSSGGLVSALRGVKGLDCVWLGWPGGDVPEHLQEPVLQECRKTGAYPVYLDRKTIEMFYNGFCNNVLWPLFHYVSPPMDLTSIEVDQSEEEWMYYVHANKIFTEAVLRACETYPPSDQPFIWVHDYHLMLVPLFIRQKRPDLRIGWFLHTPFPTHEVFRMLSFRTQILTGLLSANLLAFHVYEYQRHFMQSCLRLLGLESSGDEIDASPIGGGVVKCCSIPIGIEPTQFMKLIRQPQTRKAVVELREQLGNAKIILGVDRLDYMKGIPHKLNAFDRFLELFPEWKGKVVLIQLAVPSRSDVPEYQRLKSAVHEIVGKINGRRGAFGFTPVHYLDQSVNVQQLSALYRAADVLLITSLRDGMNLVAFEYIAAQQGKYGALILSEFTGASQSLGAGAISINPWNLDESASAINRALTLSDSQRRDRHDYLFNTVITNTSQRWAEDFIAALIEACQESTQIGPGLPIVLQRDHMLEIVERWSKADFRLLSLELLNCLVPSSTRGRSMKRMAQLITIPDMILSNLESLALQANTTITISGAQSPEMMGEIFGNLPVILIAHHGCSYRTRDGEWRKIVDEDQVKEEIGDWMKETRRQIQWFAKRFPGTFIEETPLSIAVHWDVSQSDLGQQQARELLVNLWAGPLSSESVDVNLGPCTVEIRPSTYKRDKLLRSVFEDLGWYKREEDENENAAKEFKEGTAAIGIGCGAYNTADESVYDVVKAVIESRPEETRSCYTITTHGRNTSKADYRVRNLVQVEELILSISSDSVTVLDKGRMKDTTSSPEINIADRKQASTLTVPQIVSSKSTSMHEITSSPTLIQPSAGFKNEDGSHSQHGGVGESAPRRALFE